MDKTSHPLKQNCNEEIYIWNDVGCGAVWNGILLRRGFGEE